MPPALTPKFPVGISSLSARKSRFRNYLWQPMGWRRCRPLACRDRAVKAFTAEQSVRRHSAYVGWRCPNTRQPSGHCPCHPDLHSAWPLRPGLFFARRCASLGLTVRAPRGLLLLQCSIGRSLPDHVEALSSGVAPSPSLTGVAVELTVVVAAYNESGNIAPLIAEIADVLRPLLAFEVICVDDGSTDATAAEAAAMTHAVPELRIAHHSERAGQTAAICTGVALARGSLVATIDGDGQNDPADIPALIACARGEGTALVAGIRQVRCDRWAKRLASRLANSIRAVVLRDGCPDTGCGLKVFPRRSFERLPQFDGMHRYLPALFRSRGITVVLRPVAHRPRVRGVSKYGNLGRAALGAVDLLGVLWLTRRSRSPQRVVEHP